MSAIIRELFTESDTVVMLILNNYSDRGYISSYVETLGKRDTEVFDIFAENGYEPEFYTDTKSLVLYNTFDTKNEMNNVLYRIFSEISSEEPEVFIMAIYRGFDSNGKLVTYIEYRFFANEKNKWSKFLSDTFIAVP